MMNPKTKFLVIFLLIILLINIAPSTGSRAKVLVDSENPAYYPSSDEEYVELNLRKLIEIKAIIEDYDKPEPNPKHQPKGGG
ncbi:hypothetical protein LWI29_002420 [Acer saccharum]|uniref:Uncharacterized protein n=1 Tax=Acer saccharum TaxID=4024 RepID=A0AA39RYE8_ACESA|nr:hypothetical protein LWI29_002420 [Acer saccharum]